MRDKVARSGNCISVTGSALFDCRDNFPNIFEIHFGLEYTDDPSSVALKGKSDGDVRLRFADEVHRSEIRLSLRRLLEGSRPRKISFGIGSNSSRARNMCPRDAIDRNDS